MENNAQYKIAEIRSLKKEIILKNKYNVTINYHYVWETFFIFQGGVNV